RGSRNPLNLYEKTRSEFLRNNAASLLAFFKSISPITPKPTPKMKHVPSISKLLMSVTALTVFTLISLAQNSVAQGAAKKKIGFSVYDMQYGFFQEMEKGTREASQAAGYDYVLVDQKSSESTMVSATQDLINQGISALIISPFKPDALGPIV